MRVCCSWLSGEAAQRVELLRQRLHCAIESLQIFGCAAQKMAALGALRVSDPDQHRLRRLLHLQRVQHEHVGLPGADQTNDHRQDRNQDKQEAHRDNETGALEKPVCVGHTCRHGG